MSTTITTTPTADRGEIIRAVKMIVGVGNVCEVRALDAKMDRDWSPGTISGYFDDAEKLADAVLTIKSAVGIYLTLNQVDPALLARAWNRIRRTPKGEATSDHNIIRRRWIPIDLDAQRASGVSATDEEHQAALDRAGDIWLFCHDELGWGDPLEIDSGNGAHLLYPIDLPANDGGTIEHFLKDLARRFDCPRVKVDTAVSNPARIWKLPGTVAGKGDSMPTRPHRLSRIVRYPREMEVAL